MHSRLCNERLADVILCLVIKYGCFGFVYFCAFFSGKTPIILMQTREILPRIKIERKSGHDLSEVKRKYS